MNFDPSLEEESKVEGEHLISYLPVFFKSKISLLELQKQDKNPQKIKDKTTVEKSVELLYLKIKNAIKKFTNNGKKVALMYHTAPSDYRMFRDIIEDNLEHYGKNITLIGSYIEGSPAFIYSNSTISTT